MAAVEKIFLENPLNSDVILEKAIELGQDFLGAKWCKMQKNQVKVTRITGGLSNNMFHVTSSTSATPYLLRLYRQPMEKVFADTVNFAIFSERKIGPKLYGFFDGGRMEEYLPSKTLGFEDVLKPEIVRKVGALFHHHHSIKVPVSRSRRVVHMMREWLEEYKSNGGQDFQMSLVAVRYVFHPEKVSIEGLHHEISTFEKWATELYEDTLVFSHNDSAAPNILELDSTKELVFIDWEYATYNWRGYDLATFLAERTVDSRDPDTRRVVEELNDNPPYIKLFCEAYIDADNELKNHVPTDEERSSRVESLIQECLFFWPLVHLCWAVISMKFGLMNVENGVDWNAIARERLSVYYEFRARSQKIYEESTRK